MLFDGLSFDIPAGATVGVIGANGVGKTTLLNMLTGAIAPDKGKVRLGTVVEMVTLDQSRESLDPGESLKHALTGGGDQVTVSGEPKHVIGYMKDFLFMPEMAGTPVGELSGGERGRLMLARTLARSSNLLVLDEPTNDLDFETLDLLQEMLAEYRGTVLLVSHDREFLDRTVTSIIAAEGNGRWVEYSGGYSDMQAQRRGRDDGITEIKVKTPVKTSASKPTSTGNSRLSYKETFALKTLPVEIDQLRAEIEIQQKSFADTDLYARDRQAFNAAAAALADAEHRLAEKEEEWLELEIKREEIEGH